MSKLRWMGIAFILLSLVTLEGLSAQTNENGCPRRVSKEPCARVLAYGRNPGTGRCCLFFNPCSVPQGWDVFLTLEECQAAR